MPKNQVYDSGDSSDEMEERHKNFRPLSRNEICAVVKNRIEDRKLNNRMSYIKRDSRRNCNHLNRNKKEVENSMELITATTGSSLDRCDSSIHSNDFENDLMRIREMNSVNSFEDISSSRFQVRPRTTIVTNHYDQHARDHHHHYFQNEYEIKKQVRFDSNLNTNEFRFNNNSNNNNNNLIRYAASNSQMQSLPHVRKSQSATIRRTGSGYSEDLTLWHKYQQKKRQKDGEIELHHHSGFFQDKKLQRLYIELCAQRDNVPHRSPQRIEFLKKQDPVFAKRHKQFVSAKVCNKAPKFDLNDYLIPLVIPKSSIERKKVEIIKVVTDVQVQQPPKILQVEMERVDQKVKKFVRELSTF